MTPSEKQALHDILTAIANVSQRLDAIETVLNRYRIVTTLQVEAEFPLHAQDVDTVCAPLRRAIDAL